MVLANLAWFTGVFSISLLNGLSSHGKLNLYAIKIVFRLCILENIYYREDSGASWALCDGMYGVLA